MHEMSIALGIIKIAEEETVKANMNKVERIELEIGTLAGIEIAALEFAWPSAIKGTALENAEKKIIMIQGKAQCQECNHTFELDQIYDDCPSCGSYLKTIINGKELKVKSLELCSE